MIRQNNNCYNKWTCKQYVIEIRTTYCRRRRSSPIVIDQLLRGVRFPNAITFGKWNIFSLAEGARNLYVWFVICLMMNDKQR